ncbi:MAG: hypothetical protein U1F49_05355 [Rubrivivax sp.]
MRIASPALGEQKLTVYLSLNYLSEQQLKPGSRLPMRLMRGRMRVFGDAAGAARRASVGSRRAASRRPGGVTA